MKGVILITGASSGIGKAITNTLISHGYKVYGGSRKEPDRNDETSSFVPLQLDVNDDGSVNKAIQHIQEKENGLDGLVNNAGIGLIGALEETPIDEAKEVFETNFFGTMRTSKAVLPLLRERNKGKIINIGSIGGSLPLPFRGVYCSSKAALEGFSKSLGMEVQAFGVKVYLIQPGDFKTNINNNRKVITPQKDSPYADFFQNAREVINKEVENGSDPELIGKLVLDLFEGRRSRPVYRIGSFLQRISPVLEFLIPPGVFQKQMMKYYKVYRT